MPCIFKWNSSYYCNQHWKWQYGSLRLGENSLKFVRERQGHSCDESATVVIKIDNILEVRKATTNLFYNAITIREGSTKHWFSSFSKVYDVLRTIEHFWKERLIGKDINNVGSKPANELFELLYNSQDTLLSSAKQLHTQGQQLRAASGKVMCINNDIRVGENLVSDLESWFGVWKTRRSKAVKIDLPDFEQSSDLFRADYAILFAQTQQESHKQGTLSFQADKIIITDKTRKTLYSFVVREISEITVHSPWDLTLSKFAIGKPSTSLHITSTRLPFVLQTLEKAHRYKPIYEDPSSESSSGEEEESGFIPEMDLNEPSHKQGSISGEIPGKEDKSEKFVHSSLKDVSHNAVERKRSQDFANQKTCSQGNTSTSHMSEGEAREMSSILQNMKALALDIGQEQERQIQEIEDMTTEIGQTESRLKKNNRKINNLL